MVVVSTHQPLLSAAETKARAARTTSKTSVKAVATYVMRNGDAMLLMAPAVEATDLMVCVKWITGRGY
jgi:hypothetical protein